MALSPYSVSPRLRERTVGPKPTMYCVTFTPNFLAGSMCPISCNAMESSRPTTKISTPIAYSMRPPYSGRQRQGTTACPGVRLFDVHDGTRVSHGLVVLTQPLVQDSAHGLDDAQEWDR